MVVLGGQQDAQLNQENQATALQLLIQLDMMRRTYHFYDADDHKFHIIILCRSSLQQQRNHAAYLLCLLLCESCVIGLRLNTCRLDATIRAYFKLRREHADLVTVCFRLCGFLVTKAISYTAAIQLLCGFMRSIPYLYCTA